jgi:prepilin-type N-terminal cleavage/methylation domain-containing protein
MKRAQAGMTLIEVIVVVVIIALAFSGLSFSLGALTRTNLKAGAMKLAAAARFAHYRAVIQGTTVRIVFDLPGNTFSIEEAHGQIALARADDERRQKSAEDGNEIVAVDPWSAAKSRVEQALKPNLGSSPFGPLEGKDGSSSSSRYTNVGLGRRVQIVKLIVPHEPKPRDEGKGAVHFFPGGVTEHAVIQLSDGGEGRYSVEIHPLTGRAKIHPEAYEPEQLLGDPDKPEASEVDL